MRRPLAIAATIFLCGCAAAPRLLVPPPTTASAAAAPVLFHGSASGNAPAAAPPPAVVDRDFPLTLEQTGRFAFGAPQHAKPTPDGKSVLFLRAKARDPRQSLWEMDVATGATKELLDADKLLAAGPEVTSPAEKARRERMRQLARGFSTFDITEDGAHVLVPLSGRVFVYTRASGAVREVTAQGARPVIDPHASPDGKLVAYVRDDDVVATSIEGGAEWNVTRGGSPTRSHGTAEFIAQEELDRFRGFWFSPDSGQLIYEESDTSKLEVLTIADPAHPESPPDRIPYPRPGKANADVRLGIVGVHGGTTTWIDWDRARFPYVVTVAWDRGGPPVVYVMDRLQRTGRLLAVDPASGATRTLLEEHDEAWVNYDQSAPRWLADGSGFVWTTEAHGAWRIELRDPKGALVRALTPPSPGYVSVVGVDAPKRRVIWTGGDEPTEMAVFASSLDASEAAPQRLRGAAGAVVRGVSFAGGVLVTNDATFTTLPRTFALPADGGPARELPSLAETPARLPTPEMVEIGQEGFRAVVLRPAGWVQGARYPVIDAAYGGPHVQIVLASARALLHDQWLADVTGAVVVCIDGRGTPRRGRAWERAIAGKLGTVPIEDHVAALRALAAKYPEMDLSRVGVSGWSFGGYFSARAVLEHPELYRVGVAGAPPADWRDYDTAYTERYLGLPDANAAAYEEASLLTYAKRPGASGKLLVVHGTADDNVYFFNSLKLSDALERAGKPFALAPIVGATHGVRDPTMAQAIALRTADFLRDGLR